MKIESDKIFLCGDTHGNYTKMLLGLEQIIAEMNTRDPVYVINLGDNGLGFHGRQLDVPSYVLDFLEEKNVYLYFIRGNHDNPNIFDQKNNNIFERVKVIPDNTILELNNKKWLVIGGGISIDRLYRVKGKTYYENEALCLSTIKGQKIYGILSHTGPKPDMALMDITEFLKVDKYLINDLEFEEFLLQGALTYYNPKEWFYGHYHVDWTGEDKVEGTKLNCLGISSLYHLK